MRGFVWAVYVDDDSNTWAVRVDADFAAEVSGGWDTSSVGGMAGLPRGWKPRAVLGLDVDGHLHRRRVARTDAGLWTGEQQFFTVEGTDQLSHTATVFARVAERRLFASSSEP